MVASGGAVGAPLISGSETGGVLVSTSWAATPRRWSSVLASWAFSRCPAVEAAGVRRFPPRIMRHTAASWLAQDGVPLYDIQALLGHESFVTTQRYAHLAPDAYGKVLDSWSRRRDAPLTHERKENQSS